MDVPAGRPGKGACATRPPIVNVSADDRITTSELERLVGRATWRLMQSALHGKFPPLHRIGVGQWAWSRREVLEWIAKHRLSKGAVPRNRPLA